MIPGFIKRRATKALREKAVELHSKGSSIEQIADKFWAESKVANGLAALDISPDELIKMIEKEVKKEGKK